jgi:copper ion binding protein
MIEGMMCKHCAARVEKALNQVEGVSATSVDLEGKSATVTLSAAVDNGVLAAAVTDAGYQVTDVQG